MFFGLEFLAGERYNGMREATDKAEVYRLTAPVAGVSTGSFIPGSEMRFETVPGSDR